MAVFKWRMTGEPSKFETDGMDNFYHIGLYIGNGQVIEAKGTQYGVIISSVDSWSHAGRVKGIQYITIDETQGGITFMEAQAKVTTASGPLKLRASASTSATVLLKMPKDALVQVLDRSNPLWWRVSYSGTIGYASTEFLTLCSDGSGAVR